MKIYLAYKFSGEDFRVLQEELGIISAALREVGHEVFCGVEKEQFYRDSGFGPKEIIEFSLPQLESSDTLFAYIKSDEKSEGMLLEIGYALGLKKPVIAAIKEGVKTNFIPHLANQVISFASLPDLRDKLITL